MKMKNRIAGMMLLLWGVSAGAAPVNLVLNGDFSAENRNFPPYWMMLCDGGSRTDYFRSGGPDGKGFMRLTGTEFPARIQQNNLKLLKGGKYRLGAWIRTQNVCDKSSGIRVGSGTYPEQKKNTLSGFPCNQKEWRYYEKVITLPETEQPFYPYYSVDIVAEKGGVMDVAGVRLFPDSEKEAALSLNQRENMAQCLVPLGNLYYLNCGDASLEFSWTGKIPEGAAENLECVFSFDADGKSCTVPFSAERFRADFGRLPAKEQTMTVTVRRKNGGEVFYSEKYPVRAIPYPEPMQDARELNNMVTELFSGAVNPGESVRIANSRYGFLLFKVEVEAGKPYRLLLNGEKIADEKSLAGGPVRALEPGYYTLSMEQNGGILTVRSIPDVMTFALWTPRMPGNGSYDWAFAKKYLLPGLTTFNIAGLTEEQFAELQFAGRQLLDAYGIQNWNNPNDPEDDLKRMREDKVFLKPANHGVAMDESECWYPVMLDPYAYALKHFENPLDKLLVTYQTGPVTPAYMQVISAAANVSKGRGWLAFEVYPRGQKSLQDMKNMLDMTALQWTIFRDTAPGLFDKAGVAWGNFSCPPNISLAHYPGLDYKYILDMKMNSLANNPAYRGLARTVFWGTYAADEEIARWSFRLMRHYAFEGRRDMLSDHYGFSFESGHVKNPDFEAGLTHWRVTGDVVADSFPGYGKNSMKLHGSKGAGDRFALFHRTDNSSGTLSQTVTGLKPGKVYRLYFHTADEDDVVSNRQQKGAVPLTGELKGAEILSRVHYKADNTRSDAAYVNIHKVIFRALSDTAELEFSDRTAEPGRRLILNYVSLHPYYEPEDFQ